MPSANVIVLIVVIVVALVGVLMWLWIRLKNKRAKVGIPTEILSDFNDAERRLQESNGTINPEQILWDIARKHFGGTNKGIARRESINEESTDFDFGEGLPSRSIKQVGENRESITSQRNQHTEVKDRNKSNRFNPI